MRRRDRRRTWGLWGDFTPIADRDMRLEVDERTLADGTIRTAVDRDRGARRGAGSCSTTAREAVAIIFINAYANAENERARARRPCARSGRTTTSPPRTRCCRKSASSSAPRPRRSTPICSRSSPPTSRKLESALAKESKARIHIVQSNGGIMSTATARKLPVRTALSGPAAGVVAGAALAKAAGFDNLITCDLGGTSFDVSVIANGKTAVAAQTTIDFGLVIRTPMIEITTIGAGGGSIAWVDRGGLLQVGPESAGSVPGPACYGQGNTRPTLTDAQVVLGRINAQRPLGGELKSLDVEAAKRAIAEHVGKPLGLAADDAAAAIVRVADARMAGAIRLVSIERGHDPQKFVAMPFGGGGALHVGALIREIGLKSALVPRFPGITSALGCVLADLRHDMVQTVNLMLDGLDAAALEARMAAAGREAQRASSRPRAFRSSASTCSTSSTCTISGRPTPSRCRCRSRRMRRGVSEAIVRKAFETAYSASFSRLLPGLAVRIVSLRVAAIGRRPAFDFSVFAPDAVAHRSTAAKAGSRQVWFAGGWRETAVWSRLELPAGATIEGPAILEQPDATTVIEPGLAAASTRSAT